MKSWLLVLSVYTIFESVSAKTVLSDLTPICDAKDPELNKCVVNSANLIIPHIAKGIRDYGLVPIDPLKVPKMSVGQDQGPINLNLELIDTIHHGLSSLQFRDASVDLGKGRIVLNTTLQYYSLEGRYIGKGRILLVPVVGDGRANFTYENTGTDFVLTGKPAKIKGKTYFKLEDLRVYFKFDKAHISLTNLFNGNKQLGDTTNKFLNENSLEVMKGLKGPLEDVYSALYYGLVKRITDNVPYNQLFKNVNV